jgi:prolyl oligopeptidase
MRPVSPQTIRRNGDMKTNHPIRALLPMAGSALLSATCIWISTARSAETTPAMRPPVAPVRVVSDVYFGVNVSDPYRHMENTSDPEVSGWLKDQNAYTHIVLSMVPGRATLLKRIRQLDGVGPPRLFDLQRFQGGTYFYQKRLPDENVAKLYERVGLQGRENLILDPDKYVRKPEEHFSLSYYVPSWNGRYVAYGVSPSGSEDAVIHVLNLKTSDETGETIDRSWYGGISWLPSSDAFMHLRFQKLAAGAGPTERRLKSRVDLHVVGTDPERDIPIFGYGVNKGIDLDPADASVVISDPRSPYALAVVTHGFSNDLTVYATRLDSIGTPAMTWRKILDTEDGVVNLALRGDDLYLITHKDAPRFKVTRISVSHPDLARAPVVIPTGEAVITDLSAMSDALYIQELDGGVARLLRVSYGEAEATRIPLPVDGSIALYRGDSRLDGIVFNLSSWTRAPKIYRYLPAENRAVDTKLQLLGPFDEPQDIESIETKVPTADGTMIPLSLVFKKGLKLDGAHPTLLSGYGAYGIPEDPFFDPRYLAWIEQGGIRAIAHVRGGGEYGEEWHQAGMLQNKPNTWKDFIACAEYLIKTGYTSSSRLAGEAGSAGGILIGRAFTERPDLFAAILDDVGLSDMIREMFSPGGPLNVPEYGDLTAEQGFKNLLEISAYYHVKDGAKYPAIMLTAGMNDPRVPPWQSAKMAARLQAATASGKPVLLRVEFQGGHGTIGGTKDQAQNLLADQWSFLLWQFGVPGYQPVTSTPKLSPGF